MRGIRRPSALIVGRSRELERLDAAWQRAGQQTASAIVVHGDPGIGKTALLDAFVARGQESRGAFVRVVGFSSEADLPYAGIDRLAREVPDRVRALPDRLRQALMVATGREAGEPPDRFQVGLAVLSILGAMPLPTAVVVDDAHLLDGASLAVLAFVARRLRAERVLLVMAVRPEPGPLEALAGIDVLGLGGLDRLSAVGLLNARRAAALDPHLAVKVVEQLAGHPLAIIDLAEHEDTERLALRALGDEPLPPGDRLQDLYRREVHALPQEAREYALIAAADTTRDTAVVHDAARTLGLSTDAAAALEASGLILRGERVAMRHQLVRAAVYNGASAGDRARVHLALERAADRRGYRASAAMHAAAVALPPDDAVATRLVHLADEAGARGALLARAGLLVRAAELTSGGRVRQGRRLDAAEAALGGGAALLAREQLEVLDPVALTATDRGRYLVARASLALFIADAEAIPHVVEQLASAAEEFGAASAERGQRALIMAFSYVLATESATRGITVDELGRRIGRGAETRSGFASTVLAAIHAQLTLPHAEAAPVVAAALAAARDVDDATLLQFGACVVPLAMVVWDAAAAMDLTSRMIDAATARGALTELDVLHWMLSTFQVQVGDVAAAGRSLESVRELRRAIGYPAEHVVNAGYLAVSGVPIEVADAAATPLRTVGFAGAWTVAQAGIAVRLIAEGEYAAAYERLRHVTAQPFVHVTRLALPDVVESAARAGRMDDAREAAASLRDLAASIASPWLEGVTRRSLALTTDGSDADAHYRAAIEALVAARVPGELARAHLVYGEWLRRQRRRREAREHLAVATRLFEGLRAEPFARRARREYAATGESAPPPASISDLTPQEALVADLARAGKSNPEIAATLFISPSTVDYHLRKVFRKLGITSRRQLLEAR